MQPQSDCRTDGAWDLPQVAAAQQALVEQELRQDPSQVAPYAAFLEAFRSIPDIYRSLLLDLGCGVGAYGSLLEVASPRTRYFGVDASQAMIDVAKSRVPRGTFKCQPILQTPLDRADLILMGLGAECGPETIAGLSYVFDQAPGYIIWNRVRLSRSGETGYILEPTYAEHVGKIWLWNKTDLIGFLNLSRRRYVVQSWPTRDDTLTVVASPLVRA